MLRNARGQVIDTLDMTPPKNGGDLTLSIDRPIQFAAFKALKDAVQRTDARSGSAIVLDAHTGKILAMTNWPSYDPNLWRASRSGMQVRNRAVGDVFEPGSVMKPLTIALALQQRRITPDTVVPTGGGTLHLDGRVIDDDKDFGTLTTAGVIQKSSNVGTTKIALLIPARYIYIIYVSQFPRLASDARRAPRAGPPGRIGGQRAALCALTAHRTSDDVLRLRAVGVVAAARAGLHELRERRTPRARDHPRAMHRSARPPDAACFRHASRAKSAR